MPLAGRDHPYLQRKRVDVHGLLLNEIGPLAINGGAPSPQHWSAKGDLIVPIHDLGRRLISAQTIDAQGIKTFPRGGRIVGGHHLIGTFRPSAPLVIAEGYATAASIHELTGLAVAVAFNAGNLESVATAFRDAHPDLPILIACDNDHHKPRGLRPNGVPKANAGRDAAERAAATTGATVLLPGFAADDRGTDWNDLAAKGSQAFFDQWRSQLAGANLTPRCHGRGTGRSGRYT